MRWDPDAPNQYSSKPSWGKTILWLLLIALAILVVKEIAPILIDQYLYWMANH